MGDDTMTFWTKEVLELPLRTKQIRFAVQWKNGLTSNAWAVRVEKKGDAYIYCRDAMPGQKVSLHASGKQHISFSKDSAAKVSSTGDRFMNQWWEPQYTQNAIATFRLLFPPWGLRLNADQRRKTQTVWDKNDIWIQADDERLTVVYFVIVEDIKPLRKAEGSPPSWPIGVLTLRPGKTLYVIAEHRREGNWRKTALDGFKKVGDAVKKRASTIDPKLLEGVDPILCLIGYTEVNSAYMLPIPGPYIVPTEVEDK